MAQNGNAVLTRRCPLLGVKGIKRFYEYASQVRKHPRQIERNVAPRRAAAFDPTANHILKNRSDLPVCQVPFAKIFRFSRTPNQLHTIVILSQHEGRFANVSNAGQDAMDAGGFLDEWSCLRTAKPWGPGTPTLVSSLRDAIPADDGG